MSPFTLKNPKDASHCDETAGVEARRRRGWSLPSSLPPALVRLVWLRMLDVRYTQQQGCCRQRRVIEYQNGPGPAQFCLGFL